MIQTTISMSKPSDIYRFVNLASMNAGAVSLIQNEKIINGKSIGGVLTLDLSSPVMVRIDEDENHIPINQELIKNLDKFRENA